MFVSIQQRHASRRRRGGQISVRISCGASAGWDCHGDLVMEESRGRHPLVIIMDSGKLCFTDFDEVLILGKGSGMGCSQELV